jgi:seryl-tRNA synthetase
MIRCRGVKSNGEHCTLTVEPPDSYCWHHAPERAEARRSAASKAGSSRPITEIRDLKAEIRALIDEVKSGDLDRNNAAVMIQGFRVLKDLVELDRRVRETDELQSQIEELKREYGNAS